MTAATPSDLQAWSHQRWWTVGVGLFLLQVLLIVGLSERPMEVPQAGVERWRVGWVLPGEGGAEVERWLAVVDPTAFALPGPRSFSGAAWREGAEQPAPVAVWGEPDRWLGGSTGWVGNPLATGLVAAVVVRPTGGHSLPTRTPVEAGRLPLESSSRVELGALLGARGLAEPLDVPSLTHSNLLGSTEVQVVVDADGSVFSAVVLQGSGWRVADEQALVLARKARFGPADGSAPGRQWGRMRFRWHVVQPGAVLPVPGGGS
jgi:TonB family protein